MIQHNRRYKDSYLQNINLRLIQISRCAVLNILLGYMSIFKALESVIHGHWKKYLCLNSTFFIMEKKKLRPIKRLNCQTPL